MLVQLNLSKFDGALYIYCQNSYPETEIVNMEYGRGVGFTLSGLKWSYIHLLLDE